MDKRSVLVWETRYHRSLRIFLWLTWKSDCKMWIRYFDGIFCVMRKNTIDRMLVRMNRRHNKIKLTHEVEDNETLCFLDTQIKRVDKKLTFNIYHKPMATSRYIPNETHHSIHHKSAAFNSMIHRFITTPLSTDDATTELNEI
jgi:hypothetical protein